MERILDVSGFPEAELSLTITGDRGIRRVNREYLDRDHPTNVISFAMQEGEFAGLSPNLLGDVIVSADTAAREAELGGGTFFSRLVFLILHGILHLLGYDHERSGPQEARRMEARERAIYSLLLREGLLRQ